MLKYLFSLRIWDLRQVVLVFLLGLFLSFPFSPKAYGADITLAWDPSDDPDLAGYRVYTHSEGESYDYSDPAWEGVTTTCTISGLEENTTHYFVARAYDTQNNESEDSNEVSHTTYSLLASSSSNRSNADFLEGQTWTDDIYVFLSPSHTINQVSFFVDDSGMTGDPYTMEDLPEYDLAGTAQDGSANPFDTNGLTKGLHEITALVETEGGDTREIYATFTVDNSGNVAPTADAGPDQSVNEADLVTLDASDSTDPDGMIVSYRWVQTGGSPVALSNSRSDQPTFTAPAVEVGGETLSFSLTVTDDDGLTDTSTVSVSVSGVNQKPVALAGADVTVDEETTVNLNGSGAYDPDGTVASYSWSQISGTAVSLSDADTATPHFLAPPVGSGGATLTFALTVTDHSGASDSDTVTIFVSNVNLPPVADAGSDQMVDEGNVFSLDGSPSSDPDGTLSYSWVQTGGPAVVLSDAAAIQPTATAPDVNNDGVVLTFQLTVTDDAGAQSRDTCSVTINRVEEPVVLLSLSIDGPAEVSENTTTELTATAGFSDGSTLSVTDSVSWRDDSPYASVTDDGLLVALDVDADEFVTITGSYTHENVTETLQKTVTILNENFTNLSPSKPTIVSPYPGQMECDVEPVIECETFSDPDGDVQGQAQWQISTVSDFSTLSLDVTSTDQLTEFAVPHMVLNYDTTYYARVRFYDVYLDASEWSDPVGFTTTVDHGDIDGNGVADENDVDYSIDLDGNGVSDREEPDTIKAISVDKDKLFIGVSTDADTAGDIEAIESVAAIDPSTIEDQTDRPELLDFGLLAYRLRVKAGATAKVKLYYSRQIPAGSKFYMYKTLKGWWDYTENVTFHEDGKSVTVSITDGGSGDSDGLENGIIVDPGGIGEPALGSDTVSVGGGSSGGGCFISIVESTSVSHTTVSNRSWCAKPSLQTPTPMLDIVHTFFDTCLMWGSLFGSLFLRGFRGESRSTST